MQKILTYVIQFAVVMFAISIHEAAHGWMANYLGDPTAKNQGRVTLNPIAHIDLVGTIIFPLLLIAMGAPVFGWAKPVMVNPYNLRNPRRDNMFISASGPGANILASISGIILFIILKSFNIVSLVNPGIITLILFYLIIINIFLAIFNLIPIPPLDGSGIIEGLLKGEALESYQKIKPFGFIILIVIIYAGFLDIIARPILNFIINILA
ncbi:MAG: site-2 protease family protein [Candidatus Aminicenantes bacterium]|nr:site-2 protease family protein [Candidatus Aminicenantes bacterium]